KQTRYRFEFVMGLMNVESWWIHCGLGDLAVLSGAIALRSRTAKVIIPVYEHNLVSARSFFVDFPNVQIYPVKLVNGECWGVPSPCHLSIEGKIIRTGFYHTLGQRGR